ncbi:MAG: hypothetical protein M1820_003987 [Bogoriella megaspora]|nr:MAG: hypothetical protein M1820_003987 [Bogoriella megaspora]
MTFNVWIFVWRKAGTTPEEFRTHYENSHVPLIKSLTGSLFPQSHIRHYVARGEDGTAPMVILGTPEDFTYDAFAELSFTDAAAFQQFFGVIGQGEPAVKIAEDEEKFVQREKTRAVVVGDVTKTFH